MDSKTPSKDPEKLFDIQTTLKEIIPPGRTRRSISLFDLGFEVIPPRKTQKTEYENRLHQETIDWRDLLKNKKLIDPTKVEPSDASVVDKSVLSQEQLAYLESSRHAKEFAEGHEAFMSKAQQYLDEYQHFVELVEQLMELSRQQVDAATFDLIYRCKYKQSS